MGGGGVGANEAHGGGVWVLTRRTGGRLALTRRAPSPICASYNEARSVSQTLGGGLCLWSAHEGGSPQRPRPTSWGRGSPTSSPVSACGAFARDNCLAWLGIGVDGDSCQRGGNRLWSACRGQLPPSARAHQLGGRGVLPMRRSVPMARLLGTDAPIAAGPRARGPAGPAQGAVGTYGAHTG